jgi:hypothetical protein
MVWSLFIFRSSILHPSSLDVPSAMIMIYTNSVLCIRDTVVVSTRLHGGFFFLFLFYHADDVFVTFN